MLAALSGLTRKADETAAHACSRRNVNEEMEVHSDVPAEDCRLARLVLAGSHALSYFAHSLVYRLGSRSIPSSSETRPSIPFPFWFC